jgi:transposase
MADLLGATGLCPASVVAWGERKAEDFEAVAAGIAALVAEAPVRRVEEPEDRRGLAFHRSQPPLARQTGLRGRAPNRPGHNLLIRLHRFKHDVLRFLYDFAVPFTNNQVERDLRIMKVKMKTSGRFRTIDGARVFARLRSVIATARKQGWNILRTLAAKPSDLVLALST